MKTLMAFFLCLSSSYVLADCNNESNNLIRDANCGFDLDTAYWNYGADSFAHDEDDYLSQGIGRGSVLLDAYYFEPLYYTDMSQCVDVSTNTTSKSVGGWVKQQFGVVDGECRVSAYYFEGVSCSGTSTSCFGSYVSINSSSWTHLTCDGTIPVTPIESINVWIDCNSTDDFSTNYDNLYVVPTGDSLFKNGFESITMASGFSEEKAQVKLAKREKQKSIEKHRKAYKKHTKSIQKA